MTRIVHWMILSLIHCCCSESSGDKESTQLRRAFSRTADTLFNVSLFLINATGSVFRNMAQPVPDTIHFPDEEEKVLELWRRIDAFQTSLEQSKKRPK